MAVRQAVKSNVIREGSRGEARCLSQIARYKAASRERFTLIRPNSEAERMSVKTRTSAVQPWEKESARTLTDVGAMDAQCTE